MEGGDRIRHLKEWVRQQGTGRSGGGTWFVFMSGVKDVQIKRIDVTSEKNT